MDARLNEVAADCAAGGSLFEGAVSAGIIPIPPSGRSDLDDETVNPKALKNQLLTV